MKLAYKNFITRVIIKFSKVALRIRMYIQLYTRSVNLYQPIVLGKKTLGSKGRECHDRFTVIDEAIPHSAFSVLDLGCNSGYFTLQLAGRGGVCIGIDYNPANILLGRAQATYLDNENVLFLVRDLIPETLDSLPKTDITVFMSLFHHFVRFHGEKTAVKMLEKICQNTERFLIFDTGHEKEISEWSDKLKFMGPDYEEWVKNTLKEFGFRYVHSLGVFGTSVSDVPRTLFLASK